MENKKVLHTVFYSSFKFSSATFTASTTNALKVQDVSLITASTSSITSFGKRIHLLVLGGTEGILNFFIIITSAILFYIKNIYCMHYKCIAKCLAVWYNDKKARKEAKNVICPNCSSENVQVTIEQISAKTKNKGNGCLWAIGRSLMIIFTLGLWKLIGARKGSAKTKFKSNTVAICQNCGNKWTIQ